MTSNGCSNLKSTWIHWISGKVAVGIPCHVAFQSHFMKATGAVPLVKPLGMVVGRKISWDLPAVRGDGWSACADSFAWMSSKASEMECFLCSLEISEIHGTEKYQNRCCKWVNPASSIHSHTHTTDVYMMHTLIACICSMLMPSLIAHRSLTLPTKELLPPSVPTKKKGGPPTGSHSWLRQFKGLTETGRNLNPKIEILHGWWDMIWIDLYREWDLSRLRC